MQERDAIINRVLPVCDKQSVPSETETKPRQKPAAAAATAEFPPPPQKKAVITSCPMSRWFLQTMKGSSRLISLLLQWSEQMIHAAQCIIVARAALEQAGALRCPCCSPVPTDAVLSVTPIHLMSSVSLKALSWFEFPDSELVIRPK